MLYQVIAAGAMGLFAFDYASLWNSKAHNPPQSEWEKTVKVFTEFRDVYSKFVYCVDEPFRESYYFPEMIYSIPRGENVIARIWKNESYDYILLVNMDRDKNLVTYKFKKPSPKTCIEIMYGVNEGDITISNEKNEVSVNMPYIGVVWLRGYDSEEDCTDVIKVDPEDLPDYFASSNVAYNWFGSDKTQLRNGAAGIRLKNGRIQRNVSTAETPTWNENWGDISTMAPLEIVNSLTYTATENDGFIVFSTVIGSSDGDKRTLTLPNPSNLRGKVYYIKNIVGDNTEIRCVNSDSLTPPNSSGYSNTVSIGNKSAIAVCCGFSWVIFYCG